jgi:predicted dehydrogenase
MKIGIIGFGKMGQNHYRVLKTIYGAEIGAVCDISKDADIPENYYTDCDEMLQSEALDAVIVAVPTIHHKHMASSVIKKGIPVLIEKPVASSEDEARELIQFRDKYKTLTAVGHVERFNPVVVSLISELEGKHIYSISITRIGPFPPRIKDVGVLVDLSVHDIDLVHRLTAGDEIDESRIYKSSELNGNHEDNAVITLRLRNGIIANILTNWLTPFKKRTIEVATDTAYYQADLMAQELKEYSAYKRNNSYVIRDCFVKKGEPLRAELVAFMKYVETGNPDGLASLEDGLITLETIYRHRKKQEVTIG